MKKRIRLKPGQIITDLWQRFAPSALICLLFFAAALTRDIVHSFADISFIRQFNTVSDYFFACPAMALLFATTASCLCERCAWPKWIAWPVAAVGAGAGALFVWMKNPADIPLGVVLCCLALCLHSVSGKEHPAVRISQVCGWFFVCLGISIVLELSLMLCATAFFSLLFRASSPLVDSIIPYACFLVFAPWLFLGGLPKEETPLDARVGFRKFTYVVLLPLYLLLLGILLTYIAKIAITLTMPVGEMNGYGIAALTLFVFFHLMLSGDENRLSGWFKNWCGLLLVPIVAVQGIGVWMRVSAYGLTETRVLGLIWTLLCIAVVLTSLFRKRANWFFLVAGALSILIFCTPLTAKNAAVWNQEARLRTALNANGMLDEQGAIIANPNAAPEDQEIIYSAVNYLYNQTARAGSLTAQLQSQIKTLRGEDETLDTDAVISLAKAKTYLLGFEEPQEEDEDDWYRHLFEFTGTASPTQLTTRGYDYAAWISVRQNHPSASGVILENSSLHYGSVDIDALTAALETAFANGTPVRLTKPVPFILFGEEADLAPLLNGIQMGELKSRLPSDRLTLPSGKVFHLYNITVCSYADSTSSGYIRVEGWLLTPNTEEVPAN